MAKLIVLSLFVMLSVNLGFQNCGLTQDKPLKRVSLLPQWLPQAQFAGYMVALEKGFYRDAGIYLELLQGGPGKPPLEALTSGKATFVTCWLSTAIQERAAGKEIVCLAQMIQRSSIILVARPEVKEPKDLNGRKVGLWAGHFYLQPMIFFRKHAINVEVIPNYASIALFLKGAVDAMAATWYNEYHLIINSGLDPDELTVFFLDEDVSNFPEDGLYTLQQTYEADPETCRDFVEASLKGWKWAFDHKEQALDIVMKYADAAHTGSNKPHQRWMLDRMKDLILSSASESDLGKLNLRDYEYVTSILKNNNFIENVPWYEDFYRGKK